MCRQQTELRTNIEERFFWTSDYHDSGVRKAKIETVQQMRLLNMDIVSRGFFDVNRKFFLSVCESSPRYDSNSNGK